MLLYGNLEGDVTRVIAAGCDEVKMLVGWGRGEAKSKEGMIGDA